MAKATRLRWTVLIGALTATLAAIVYPVEDEAVVPRAPRAATSKNPVADVVPVPAAPPWVAADSDPFAPRGWQPPPPPPPPAPAPAAVLAVAAPAAVAPPPPPPPLPYKFMGQMKDGSATVVYLALDDQVVLARAGELLDGGYKVAAISSNQIEFESVTLGIRQSLPIPVQE